MQHTYSDAQLLKAILDGGRSLEEAIGWLYHHSEFRKQTLKLVKNFGGTQEDAEDVFQEGLAALVMNIRKGSFKGDSKISTYFFKICKYCWYSKFDKKKKQQEIKDNIGLSIKTEDSPEDFFILTENQKELMATLGKLGSICQKIISYWMAGFRMDEIAAKVGYKNANVVGKKKHHCMKALKALVKEQPNILGIQNK